jgi:hypothetical protein
VTAYRFLSPISLFSVLHGIEAQIAALEWDVAAEDGRNLGDEARQQKSGDSRNASLWREFILHVDCLNLSLRAKDGTGCVGELATLHSALATLAGPERKE